MEGSQSKPLCRLCLSSVATQTGSHLLSSFMVESLVGERGYEKGYLITADPNFDYIQNIGAKPILADFILCRGCEQRLAYVESYISQEFIQKYEKSTQVLNFQIIKSYPDYSIKECLRLNSCAFILFIASVLWRISISSNRMFDKFKITDGELELLRDLLNRLLPKYENFKVKPDKKEWLNSILTELPKVSIFKFAIVTCLNEGDKTANLVAVPSFVKYPYSLMLNEFILLVYFNGVDFNKIQDYFQLGTLLKDMDTINSIDNNIRITYISQMKWRDTNIHIGKVLVNQKKKALDSFYTKIFYSANKRYPTTQELSRLILQIRFNSKRS